MKNLGIVLTLANLRSLHDAPGKSTLSTGSAIKPRLILNSWIPKDYFTIYYDDLRYANVSVTHV